MERFWLPPLNFLPSSFLIAREHTIYDRASFSLMCLYMGGGTDPVDLPTPAVIKPIELWTGKQLCSVLVCPNDTETEDGRETEAMCANDGFSYFYKSEMLSGHLGKGTLGSGNKDGLFSVLHREYKTHAAASCMDRAARMRRPERLVGSNFFADIHVNGNN